MAPRFSSRPLDEGTRDQIKDEFRQAFELSEQTMRDFSLGEVLRNIREQAGMTLQEVAHVSGKFEGIGAGSLQKIEEDAYGAEQSNRKQVARSLHSGDAKFITVRDGAPRRVIRALKARLPNGVNEAKFVQYNTIPMLPDAPEAPKEVDSTSQGGQLVALGKGLEVRFRAEDEHTYQVTVTPAAGGEPATTLLRFEGNLDEVRQLFLDKCRQVNAPSLPARIGMAMIRGIVEQLAVSPG